MTIFKSAYPPVEIANEAFGDRLMAALQANAVNNPDKKALVDAEDDRIGVTYDQLYSSGLSIAAFLEEQNFGHKDMACVVLHNCWEWVPIFAGCSLQGGTVSGINVMFTVHELERQFLDYKPKIVFCSDSSLEKVLKAARNCSTIRTIVVVDTPTSEDYSSGVHRFSNALKTPLPKETKKKNINVNEDIVVLPYSSGTTGFPKGVMITHKNFGTMMNITIDYINNYIYKDLDVNGTNDNLIMISPFCHNYGFGILMQTLINGRTGVIMNHFDPELFFRSIEKFKVRFTFTTLALLISLAKHPLVSKYDLSTLEIVISTGASVGKDISDEIYKKHPNLKHVLQGYGMTELYFTHLPDVKHYRPGSVGRIVALTEMKITDVETGRELGVKQKGEILLRGPTVMLGYLNKPQATAETIDENGWFHTGDIGYIEEDGSLFIVERLKELIKVGGVQVAPAELEGVLLGHPEIKDAAVIGVPDPVMGEVPKAFVVRVNDRLTEKQVQEFVKGF